MEQIFLQLAVILLLAFVVSYIVNLFKQPILVGYIIAGVLVSPFIITLGISTDLITTLSRFGIAFLLFMVGLHLNPKTLKEIGLSSVVIGLLQIAFTFGVAFIIAYQFMDFSMIASAYIGVALAFSSTILVMKLLSDKQDLESLYAKISIGVLIVQDLVAAGVLMFISSTSGVAGAGPSGLVWTDLLAGFGLIIFLLLFGYFILPFFTKRIAKSQELLFLFSICWCFVIAALFNYLGFSIEIGALVAGVALSMIPYSAEVSSRISPLRDFFLIIFFIILGFNADFSNIKAILVPSLIFSLIVLIIKPVIVMALSAWFGYTKRTNFLVGVSLGQISEFSLIVLFLGVSLGQIGSGVLHTIILTMIITILLSTYMMIYSEKFYEKMKWFANIFEKKNVTDKADKENMKMKSYHVMLFGYNRIGFSILNSLRHSSRKYLVVDFNPETILRLKRLGIPALYGDVDDVDFLQELHLDKLELAVSTVPECETNSVLIDAIKRVNKDAIIIVRAHTIDDALELYRKGADYVLTPHFLGGEYVSKMITDLKLDTKGYEEEREKHIRMLKEAAKRGEEHPRIEKG